MKLLAPALLALLMLAGCSPAPKDPTPPLDQAQETALRASLKAIDPSFADTKGVVNAQIVCRSIIRGVPEDGQVTVVQERFSGPGSRMPETEARKILDAVKSNGFCKQA